VASDERAGEVAQTRMESTESQPDDDDDMSATSAAFENNSNNIDEQERQELFNEGVALGFQLGYAAGLDQATGVQRVYLCCCAVRVSVLQRHQPGQRAHWRKLRLCEADEIDTDAAVCSFGCWVARRCSSSLESRLVSSRLVSSRLVSSRLV
jgi:hypothetical protein